MPRRYRRILVAGFAIGATTISPGAPAAGDALSSPTTITYRGHLERRGVAMNGHADLFFSLFDLPTGGNLLGRQALFDVPVDGGSFAVELDFGIDPEVASGSWLEIRMRAGTEEPEVLLEPRQRLQSGEAGSGCTVGGDLRVDGNLGIGVDPAFLLDVANGSDATVTGGGQIRIRGGLRELVLDGDEIMGRGLGAPARILINADGGNVGIGTQNPDVSLHVDGGTDSSPGGGGYLVTGAVGGLNLSFDNNEIMARNNGSTATLYLNNNGGDVVIGGNLGLGLQYVEGGGASVSCPAGKKVLGGGCWTDSDSPLLTTRPNSTLTGWQCAWDTSGFITVKTYAICARFD
ncbi:MAG: hypothetical protein AB7G12_07155 [Thermoanaerobaculia bacterium]